MKKKTIIIASMSVLLAGTMLIPQMQVAAESALSIFRVNDTKTIKITVTDLQDMMDYVKSAGLSTKLDHAKTADGSKVDAESKAGIQSKLKQQVKSEVKAISNPRDFTGFAFNLPQSLKSENPKLYAVDSTSQSITLNTTEINAELKKLGGTPLDSSLNGAKITINTPPAAIAEYSDVMLVETQGVYVDSPDNAVRDVWGDITSLPMIPADLSSQLATIDPTGRDIYLPVIEGLGRETDLGSTTGYIYSAKDLAQVTAMMPSLANVDQLSKLSNSNASVLIWVKDGVLYCLAGNQSDSQLSLIARSIRG